MISGCSVGFCNNVTWIPDNRTTAQYIFCVGSRMDDVERFEWNLTWHYMALPLLLLELVGSPNDKIGGTNQQKNLWDLGLCRSRESRGITVSHNCLWGTEWMEQYFIANNGVVRCPNSQHPHIMNTMFFNLFLFATMCLLYTFQFSKKIPGHDISTKWEPFTFTHDSSTVRNQKTPKPWGKLP